MPAWLCRAPSTPDPHPNPAVHHLAETAGWTRALAEAAFRHSAEARPIFLGGDHSLSAGTAAGMALRSLAEGRPLFLLWLDAHADFHTLTPRRAATCTASRSPTSPGGWVSRATSRPSPLRSVPPASAWSAGTSSTVQPGASRCPPSTSSRLSASRT
ncbi:arginase family protein [Methylobacterium gregans]|uniref:arginase family protein n=1 Tax=Methylobacterium gregans TaxID=374424 RepID=UPI0035219927